MSIHEAMQDELDHLSHIIEAVPFTPGSETNIFFLGIFKIKHKDLADLELTEASWEQNNQVAVNKLLKFSISLGNLVRTFQIDKEAYDAKMSQQDSYRRSHGLPKQSANPFNETFVPSDRYSLPVPSHYVNFLKNLALIMKNFDIGTSVNRNSSTFGNYMSKRISSNAAELSTGSLNGSSSTLAAGAQSSPIRLNSKQLLIEKLEINIRLDPLFTAKIVFKLFLEIFSIITASLSDIPPEYTESELSSPTNNLFPGLPTPKVPSEESSIFSSLSGGQDSLTTVDDYFRCIREVLNRVNTGIVYPFTTFIQSALVNPHIIQGFQNLVETI